MSSYTKSRKGERGVINAAERAFNLLEEYREDAQLVKRLRFEQSVRALVKAIPEEWQDSKFVNDMYEGCLKLLERKGINFKMKTYG